MKLIIQDDNDQVYTADYGTPTIQLGDGKTNISSVVSDEGFAGICFSESSDVGEVGISHDEDKGKSTNDVGAYLQIITTNYKSLDALIKACESARSLLPSPLLQVNTDIICIPYTDRYKTDADGYRWVMLEEAKKQLKTEHQWISVLERLPEDCTEVIFYDVGCGGSIEVGFFEADCFNDSVGEPVDGVTHWQPLPPAPTIT